MNSKLKIVLDTNVFLVSIASHFKYFWVYEKLQKGEYELYVSNEILTEYEEQISKRFGLPLADASLDFLLLFPNVHLVIPHYKWQLILHDPDDDKFVDCAIASNTDYIITNDKHFNILKTIEFPEVKILNINEFKEILDS